MADPADGLLRRQGSVERPAHALDAGLCPGVAGVGGVEEEHVLGLVREFPEADTRDFVDHFPPVGHAIAEG